MKCEQHFSSYRNLGNEVMPTKDNGRKEENVGIPIMNLTSNPSGLPASLSAFSDVQQIPLTTLCGIYFLVENGEVVYVGQSIDVMTRIQQQRREKQFDSAYFVPVAAKDLDATEFWFINKLRPKYNRNMGKAHKLAAALLDEHFPQNLKMRAESTLV